MTKNLRTKLIVIFLIIGLIPAIIVNVVFYFRIENRERDIIYRDSIRLLESISGNLNNFFQFHTAEIETLANDQSISLPVSLLANTEPNSNACTSLTTVSTLSIEWPRIMRTNTMCLPPVMTISFTTLKPSNG